MGRQIEVYPDKAEEWRWRRRAANNRKSATSGEAFSSRSAAIKAAREERKPDERIVLLRQDGSLVGELDHAVGSGEATEVELEPAGEEGSAG